MRITFVRFCWGCVINFYLTIPLLTSVALIQTVLLSRINLWGARPELMLLVVLIWAVVRGVDEGLVWGFVGGLVVDLLSGAPMGAMVLALLSVVFVAGQPWGQGLSSQVAQLLLPALVGVVVYHLVLLLVLAWTGHAVDWGFALLRVAGPSALLNTMLAPFVRQPLAWLERRTRREGFAR